MVRSLSGSIPKKSQEICKEKKKNNVNIIGSSNHAGAGFAFMGSLLLHHSNRCMDALVFSRSDPDARCETKTAMRDPT